MENNLLRIGILLLVGLIIFNIVKQTNVMGGQEEATFEEAENDQLKMVVDNARINNGPSYDLEAGVRPHQTDQSQLYDYNHQVLPYPQIATNPQDANYQSGGVCQPTDPGCFSGSTLQAPDLLPQDQQNNAWNETSPQTQGHITDQNFLESGHHYGINTVGQSLRNANRQLRSDPLIPKVNVSPWLNSTVSADTNRKQFEIVA